MVLFNIPDIRLFWSENEQFLSQFSAGKITKFKPYSKFPPVDKDIAFWIPPTFHSNDLFELVRSKAGDLVESVQLVDTFEHPKTKKVSNCYRIMYRSMDRNLTNKEIDFIQDSVRKDVVNELHVELR
jgi:phenylalanyl-tRNA synthetase alpha chain